MLFHTYSEKPMTDNPTTVNPTSEKPTSDNPTQIKKERKKKEKENIDCINHRIISYQPENDTSGVSKTIPIEDSIRSDRQSESSFFFCALYMIILI